MKLVIFALPILLVASGCASKPRTESISVVNESSVRIAVTATGAGGRVETEVAPGERRELYGATPKAIGTSVSVATVPPGKLPSKTVAVSSADREWERGYLVTFK